MPLLSLASHDLHYQMWGDAQKPVLVFSNSLGTDLSMWQAQVQALQADYALLCYDQRGHGLSGTPQQGFELSDLGQDVVALLDHLHISSAYFCGISMGGLTGLWLAIHHPERFKAMVVSNTAAKIGQESAWLERAALVRAQGLHSIAASAPSRWFTPDFIANHADVVQALVNGLASGNAQGYALCCEALALADVSAQLNDIDLPMLIVAGEQDPVTTVADALMLQEHIFGSQVHVIGQASHIANVEQSEAFNHAIIEYLAYIQSASE